MAKKLETIERDGKLISVYDNGLELDAVTGKIVKRPDGVAFTSETGKAARLARHKKMQRTLRRGILEEHNASMPNPVKTSAEAFGAAGAMLYSQVVLNSEAYPRDRKEIYEMLAKYADVVPDKKESEDNNRAGLFNAAAAASAASVQTALLIAQILRDVMNLQEGKPIVIDGKSVTVEGKLIE